MRKNQVTIKDLAEKLNISVATVSRALRGMPEIHPETRKTVLALAQEMDYQPNQLATSLVKSSTRTIGVIVPNAGYYFFSSVISGIEETAAQHGYSILLCQSNESYQREIINIQDLTRGQVEGLIVSLSRETFAYEHFQKLLRKHIPLVIFDRYTDEIAASKVIIDNREAGLQATRHLLEKGCRRIAYLGGPHNMQISNERLAGYQQALQEQDLPFDKQYIMHCDYTLENAIQRTYDLVNMPPAPDGILAVSDRIATASLFALRQRGVQVPDDVAIIGFNDEPVSALLTPTLSSVAQPTFQMGQIAVELLLQQIQSPAQEWIPVTQVLATEIKIRESSDRKRS
jgi:LacI family transcriptional regulator